MKFAIYKTKIGEYFIGYEGDVLIKLHKCLDEIEDFGVKTNFTEKVFTELEEYFESERKEFTFKYEMRGTEFQKKVWSALCDIPYGETRTYKDIAVAIGNQKASRAVGMANNKNPIAIVVPCHRVIGANGKLVGYAGGLDIKEALLKIEGVL